RAHPPHPSEAWRRRPLYRNHPWRRLQVQRQAGEPPVSSRVAVKAALLALAFMLVILGISAYSLSVDRNSELTDSLAFGCAVASELLESAEDDAQRVAILETLPEDA